eukprot:CAMPEP_0114359492 /NCGR_PEP_ID=MMETSP0101-20121206/23059_1 /TAXON_ID=38822 ORGANISM="Pteridomonas danica, Strain PT" /NCGR_SAMPLE_ID=MMETSP0101 /ASSEMBLY_ACC=CAM_ASM_000211 /LENGTH=295 /DNA_ID=CAMNT_0001503065 /DNA_START=30 /DNA_END=917 /DNA_ORIENTATION=-
MGKEKKEKKEKKVEPEVEKVEKKEKKAKKEKKEKAEPVVEVSPKKEKKEKKEKKRKAEEKEEEEVAAVVETKKEKKSKKSKKEAEPAAVEEEAEPEPAMKVHTKAPAPVAEPTCEVFMGNLSFQIDEASLQDAFKECGTITNCKWLEHSDTGKFKGCGFITFSSPDEAGKAVAMDGTDVLGRAIKVDFSQGKPAGAKNREVRPMQAKPDGCNTLFAGNLSFDIDDDQIKEFFKDCGDISSIRWLTDKETQQFKGCGFVEFSDPDASLDKAAALNGQNLLGRSIRLDYAAPRASKW